MNFNKPTMFLSRRIYSIRPFLVSGNATLSSWKMQQDCTANLSRVLTCLPQTIRTVHLATPNCAMINESVESSLWKRMISKINFLNVAKYRHRVNGYLLYEDIVANVNYIKFFTDFNMPDTFYSWFVITELHIWMLMIRFMAEGPNGHELRNFLVEAMWADVNIRKNKLKKANVSALRRQIGELSQQFNAAVIGYDEGITSDDKVLAGAIWRRFFQCEGNNPESIERLVAYVRKQVNELDKLPSEEIMVIRSIRWLDIGNP